MRVGAVGVRFLQLGLGPLLPLVTLGFPLNKGICQNLPTFFAPLILPSLSRHRTRCVQILSKRAASVVPTMIRNSKRTQTQSL